MTQRPTFFVVELGAVLLLATGLLGGEALAPQYKASKVLPTELRSGPGFSVDEEVGAEGFAYRFTLRSDYGVYQLVTVEMLRTRIDEVRILMQCTNISGLGEFTESLKTSVVQYPLSASQLIMDPVQSVKNIESGIKNKFVAVGQFFSGRKKSRYEDGLVREFALGGRKREAAMDLGLDVYSSNPQVQKLLLHLARLRAAGQAPVQIGGIFIPTSVGIILMVLEERRDVNKDLRSKSADDLHSMNSRILRKLKIEEQIRDGFLNNPCYSPRHRTVICADLEAMSEVTGLQNFVLSTLCDTSEEEALFAERQADMLLCYHRKVEKIDHLSLVGRIPAAITKSKTMVLLGPADIIRHTEVSDAMMAELAKATVAEEVVARKIVITGTFAPDSKQRLMKAGYECVEHFLLDTPTQPAGKK